MDRSKAALLPGPSCQTLELMRLLSFAFLLIIWALPIHAKTIAMKQISYRGGLITFSVPKHWVEEYSPEGGGTFYENAPNTGTLRLNVITATPPASSDQHAAKNALAAIKNPSPSNIQQLPNGNEFSSRVQRATEQGHALRLYWWHLARQTHTGEVRVANFSYTILSAEENNPRTVEEIKLLETAIRNAYFHPASSR